MSVRALLIAVLLLGLELQLTCGQGELNEQTYAIFIHSFIHSFIHYPRQLAK